MHQGKSDIFFLNKTSKDEEDGTKIFSVGGSPSIRLNRRKNAATSVFPTGCMGTLKEEEEKVPLTATSTEEDDEELKVEQKSSRSTMEYDADAETASIVSEGYVWKRNPLTGEGVEVEKPRKHKKGPRKRLNKWVW